ncbi:Na/Pi symporter [Azospirillum halopraeferens]|uniref:Na/Pi symporter n=1 Tax=Azospirillum halopraeferens TaxID=34010 RepID=UPI00041E9E7D|nr:Na/Pi symporter [Azospirillum halopraeferens]
MDVFVGLLAGLGFIFIGTQFLTANMKQVVGPRFHTMMAGATGHPLRAAAVGTAAGAVIQSTNAVTFIVIALVSAGAATVREAMPIVTWSYAGSTLRLLVASLDLRSATLLAVGLIGIAFLLGYDRSARHRHLVAAILGLTLLLYGVQLMVESAVPLRQSETLRTVLALADRFYPWGFIAGTLIATVIQGQTVSVVAVALAEAGVLDPDQTVLVVVGANLGAGLQAIIQGAGLKGTHRQLNLYQLVLKLIGVAVLLPLLLLEHYAGVPTILALVALMPVGVALQVTAVHWLFQIVSALVASALNGPLFHLIERLSPPTDEEALAKPEFVDRRAVGQPLVALTMVEQEHRRLLRRLPDFLAPVREDAEAPPPLAPPAVLHAAGKELTATIDGFLKATLESTLPPAELERLMRRWNGNELLGALHGTLGELVPVLARAGDHPDTRRVRRAMAESLHTLLLVLIEEAEDTDAVERGVILHLTNDRSDLMRRIREDLSERADLPLAQRQAVWRATDLFERTNWLLRRYAINLGEREEAGPAAALTSGGGTVRG